MERVFTKDIIAPAQDEIPEKLDKDGNIVQGGYPAQPKRVLYKKGDLRDYQLDTWLVIAKTEYPNAKNPRAMLDKFSAAVEDIGKQMVA